MKTYQATNALYLKKCFLSIFSLTLFTFALSISPANAVDFLICEGPPAEFEDPNPFWDVSDDAGNGVMWGNLSDCGMVSNFTGGTGDVYCVVPAGVGYDTYVETETFTLRGATSASLNFKISYDDVVGGFDRVELDISIDNAPYINIATYDSDQGIPYTSGLNKLVNLNSYLGSDDVALRWRYRNPTNNLGGYVQIDDLELNCGGGADISTEVAASQATVIEGQELTYTFKIKNAGPLNAIDSFGSISSPVGFLSAGIPEITGGILFGFDNGTAAALLQTIPPGSEAELSMPVRAFMAPEVTLDVNSPAGISGNYEAKGALFGPTINPASPISGLLVLADDGTLVTGDGCEPISNGNELSGNIALLDTADGCSRDEQVKNAEKVGARAAIIIDEEVPFDVPGFLEILSGFLFDVMTPSGNVTSPISIPSALVQFETGDLLKMNIGSSPMVTLSGVEVLSQERSAIGYAGGGLFDPDFSIFNENTDNISLGSVMVLKDTDLDGTADINDDCRKDASKTTAGICGCGVADGDQNGNGFIDCISTDELKHLISSAKKALKKIKEIAPTGDASKDKKKAKAQKKAKKEFLALLNDIVNLVLNPILPIQTVSGDVDLEKLAKQAKKKGKKATKTKAANFVQNKKKAQRSLKKLEKSLA